MNVGFVVTDEKVDGKVVLRLEGRLDAHSAPTLESQLSASVEGGEKDLIADFTKVTYLSSAGMRLLLATTKKLKAAGGAFVLFSMHEDVMEIIKMAGFERILNIFNSEQEALAAL